MKKNKPLSSQLRIGRRGLWFLLPVLLLCLAGCKDEAYFERNPETSITVEERLRANPDYSDFVTLLDNTGMMRYIRNSGLWTVYAPTNAAMENVNLNPTTTQERLNMVLRLNYHFGLGLRYTSAIKDGDRQITRMGKYLSIEAEPYTVDGVEFGNLKPNQSANNGVIHEIDEFLMPLPNGPGVIANMPNMSKFYNALRKVRTMEFDPRLSIDRNNDGIIDDSVFVERFALNINLANEGTRSTIFAPTNDAVDAWLANQGINSLDDLTTAQLTTFLNKHVVAQYLPSAELTAGKELTTTGGTGKFIFDPAIVVEADRYGSNAVVHIINTVLTH